MKDEVCLAGLGIHSTVAPVQAENTFAKPKFGGRTH